MKLLRITRRANGERGQALVELALIVPVIMVMLGGVLEFGFAFTADLSLETASREGARVAAALGNYGTQGICPNATAEATVDPTVVSTVQASLTRGGVDLTGVQVSIYRADTAGNPTSDINTYAWNGSAFVKTSGSWTACSRHDGTFGGGIYDQVGVKVSYTYHSKTGLLAVFTSGLAMTASAVFPIGPPWQLN